MDVLFLIAPLTEFTILFRLKSPSARDALTSRATPSLRPVWTVMQQGRPLQLQADFFNPDLSDTEIPNPNFGTWILGGRPGSFPKKPAPPQAMDTQPEAERDGVADVFAACREGQVERVRNFLTRGEASAETRDEKGYSLLSVAAERGQAAIVELLLEHGASVNYASDTNPPALILASLLRHLDVVQLLLESGASVDQSFRGPHCTGFRLREWLH
jgi:hypothetical protein